MASRIVTSALEVMASVLLWLAAKLILISQRIFHMEEIDDDIEMGETGWRKPDCEHSRSVAAAAMGAPLKRKCLDCGEDYDGSKEDGD